MEGEACNHPQPLFVRRVKIKEYQKGNSAIFETLFLILQKCCLDVVFIGFTIFSRFYSLKVILVCAIY